MRTRRGIASVVGMVFAIIALTTTIAYISYSMGILNNFNQSVLVKNQQLTDVDKEKFQISSVTVPNGKLDVTVANTGSLPIQFTKMWVQNTSATDWVESYTLVNNFVSAGRVLTNIGQNVPVSINPSYSYNVKMVTSRGNTQQFSVDSINTSKLNVQLMFVPSTVTDGFNSTLMMVVTNNSTGTLTNISPSPLPAPSGTATCIGSSVSPPRVSTLAPGSSAIFKWDIKISGYNGAKCTYTFNPPLQNGYSQSIQATLTTQVITFTESTFSQSSGILTINYTSFGWVQQNTSPLGWNSAFSLTSDQPTIFRVNVTNNNMTGDFYISKYAQLSFHGVKSGGGGTNDVQFFIANSTSMPKSFSVASYGCGTPNDYCIKIPAGQTVTLYFSPSTTEGSDDNNLCHTGSCGGESWDSMLLLFGKFATSRSQTADTYGQDIPFLAVQT